MKSRTSSGRPVISVALALAVLCTYSMMALAAPQQKTAGPTGDLAVVGQVTVNGTAAISGATVFTDSTITTGERSSAVVSLGKMGRVELLPQTTLRLTFTDGSVTGGLDSGRVRMSTSTGVAATVTTKDGMAVADNTQPAVFLVDVECGNTVVNTQTGRVELRAGNAVKQIAAGSQDTAGQAAPGTRCARLTRGDTFGALGGGALAALLLAAGGAVVAAIIAATSDDNDLDFGGGTPIVVSPTR